MSAKASERSAAAAERAAAAEESSVEAARAALEVERERDRVARLANTPTVELEAVFDPSNADIVCYVHNHGPTLARDLRVCLRDQFNTVVLISEKPIPALAAGDRETVVLPVPTPLLEGLNPHQLRVEEAFRPWGVFHGPDLETCGVRHARWLARDVDAAREAS